MAQKSPCSPQFNLYTTLIGDILVQHGLLSDQTRQEFSDHLGQGDCMEPFIFVRKEYRYLYHFLKNRLTLGMEAATTLVVAEKQRTWLKLEKNNYADPCQKALDQLARQPEHQRVVLMLRIGDLYQGMAMPFGIAEILPTGKSAFFSALDEAVADARQCFAFTPRLTNLDRTLTGPSYGLLQEATLKLKTRANPCLHELIQTGLTISLLRMQPLHKPSREQEIRSLFAGYDLLIPASEVASDGNG